MGCRIHIRTSGAAERTAADTAAIGSDLFRVPFAEAARHAERVPPRRRDVAQGRMRPAEEEAALPRRWLAEKSILVSRNSVRLKGCGWEPAEGCRFEIIVHSLPADGGRKAHLEAGLLWI
jgi:hypothetical protein